MKAPFPTADDQSSMSLLHPDAPALPSTLHATPASLFTLLNSTLARAKDDQVPMYCSPSSKFAYTFMTCWFRSVSFAVTAKGIFFLKNKPVLPALQHRCTTK